MITKEEWQHIVSRPKAELHVHLEGTLTPSLVWKLAQKNNIALAHNSEEKLKQAWQFETLPEFLGLYYASMDVLQTEENFFELAYQYFERAAHDNIIYVEAFFDPQGHTLRGVTFSSMMRGFIRAKHKAKEVLNVDAHYILCFLRDRTEEEAWGVYEQSWPWREHILGYGLDSDGYDNPPRKFQRLFEQIRQDGFPITMHAELDQKDIHEQLDECLHLIQVDRIDHGVNAADKIELLEEVCDKDLGLTVCPLSMLACNQTAALDKIERLIKAGAKVTINSDDPGYFGGYLNDNLAYLADSGRFSAEELNVVIDNAFNIAWCYQPAQ